MEILDSLTDIDKHYTNASFVLVPKQKNTNK